VFHSRLLASIGRELVDAREFRDAHGYLPASYDRRELVWRILNRLDGAFQGDIEAWISWLREVRERRCRSHRREPPSETDFDAPPRPWG